MVVEVDDNDKPLQALRGVGDGWGRWQQNQQKPVEAMMTAAAMLCHKGRQWGNCDDDDGEEEVVEMDDDNNEPLVVSGGGGRQKGRFEESSRRTARPTAPTGRMGPVMT
jgi:hypothetical protein